MINFQINVTIAKDLGGGAVFFRFLCRIFLILSSLLGTHQYFERLLYGIYQEVYILMLVFSCQEDDLLVV